MENIVKKDSPALITDFVNQHKMNLDNRVYFISTQILTPSESFIHQNSTLASHKNSIRISLSPFNFDEVPFQGENDFT